MEQVLELFPIEDGYIVMLAGRRQGIVRLCDNPYHLNNRYVKLEMPQLESSISAELFGKIRVLEKRPLQMMISSENGELAAFLRAGGFTCRRKCYEAEVGTADLIGEPLNIPLLYCCVGDSAYDMACRLMFASYGVAHSKINPWTAGFGRFCETMPKEAIYAREKSGGFYAAFVEGNEVAYVCGTDRKGFGIFARGLVTMLLAKYPTICFECDDCDSAAMELRSLFSCSWGESFDTYVLE